MKRLLNSYGWQEYGEVVVEKALKCSFFVRSFFITSRIFHFCVLLLSSSVLLDCLYKDFDLSNLFDRYLSLGAQ